MKTFIGIGLVTAIIYWIFIDGTYLKIYLLLLLIYTIFTQIGTLTRYNNSRKKCNIATWNGPNDPQILMVHEWDVERAKEYLESRREETGLALTLTHLVAYCAGRALKNDPEVNGRICFGNVGLRCCL
eukprot:TRINITY_DN1877_c0_g1_i15.p4 TRINITY_DN1877_c0_g1~~TRINITY_DN1877_c0_g1_i15.p4  ORF type:complete len:128 (+),score=38.32 TRINITY_DN1877_c0_g1_i15:204-587(+)